jgi:ubiquinone/menaquinone biosynthesis C-methylase UbiE
MSVKAVKETIPNEPSVRENESIISRYDRMHFGSIRFVRETLYGLFVNPFDRLIAAKLEQGQRVLEVGCGPGYFTIPAAEIVGAKGHVNALDINPAAVEYVRRKIKRQGKKNIEVMLADAGATGLPESSVDVALLFGIIHAFPNLDEVLTEMHRVLKPDGKLSIQSRRSEKQLIDTVTSTGLFHLEEKNRGVTVFAKIAK